LPGRSAQAGASYGFPLPEAHTEVLPLALPLALPPTGSASYNTTRTKPNTKSPGIHHQEQPGDHLVSPESPESPEPKGWWW
jgi:hypothetical protein